MKHPMVSLYNTLMCTIAVDRYLEQVNVYTQHVRALSSNSAIYNKSTALCSYKNKCVKEKVSTCVLHFCVALQHHL